MGKAKPSSIEKSMEPSTLHRKLEPIYELIDGGNNKAALKSIDRELLGKYPTLQIGRVLKGIVLSRLGKDEEGLELCESVRREGPHDDTVLHTLSLYYKNTGRMEETIAMFEWASTQRGDKNPEYLALLFQAYARSREFMKQQRCAMKLYRLSSDKKHIMWAVCGALLQTRIDGGGENDENGNDTSANSPALLQLASTMCAKLETAGSVDDRETCLVYARVLRDSGKNEMALELLESALGERCIPMASERRRLCALQASACGQPKKALEHWRAVLETAPDDWEAAVSCLDITMPGTKAAVLKSPSPPAGGRFMNANAHRADGDVSSSSSDLTQAVDALKLDETISLGTADDTELTAQSLAYGLALVTELKQSADAKGGAKLAGRGPYLLAVEYAWRASQLSSPNSFEKLSSAILDYWHEFGAWTSCARDLAPYAERMRDSCLVSGSGTSPDNSCETLQTKLTENSTQQALSLFDVDSDEKTAANRRARRCVAAASIYASLGKYGGSWRDVRSVSRDVKTNAAVRGLSRPNVSENTGRDAAQLFASKYRLCRKLVPENADPREQTLGDTFALLGVNALCAEASSRAAESTKEGDVWVTTSLLAAAALAEEALLVSPNHAELRLGLASVYTLLGAATAASDVLTPLDIKNIQMDTMAHHVLPGALGGTAPNVALAACRLAAILRIDASRDIAEAQIKAYENGVYTKALEFVDFHSRLRDSFALETFLVVKSGVDVRERTLGVASQKKLFPNEIFESLNSAVTAIGPLPASQKAWRDSLRFNEDLTLNPTWHGPYHGHAGLSACDWWESRGKAAVGSNGVLSEVSKLGFGQTNGVPVAGMHDHGVGFGVSVAHRRGWANALHRRKLEMHALFVCAKLATTNECTETEIANVVAACHELWKGQAWSPVMGNEPLNAGEPTARALAPFTDAVDTMSDAGLTAVDALLHLRKSDAKTNTVSDAAAAAEMLEGYADLFSKYCKQCAHALSGGVNDTDAEGLVERLCARGTVPSAFHAVSEAGTTVTITLRLFAQLVTEKTKLDVSEEERKLLLGSLRSSIKCVSSALRDLSIAATTTAFSEGKEADTVAEKLDTWFRSSSDTKTENLRRRSLDEADGKTLQRESCVSVSKRVVTSHRVTLNAIKKNCESFETQLGEVVAII